MTDSDTAPAPGAAPRTDAAQAGALLRAARQQQGLHIAALAASIKVTPAKLEALEAGRLNELPDATFARALAKTVCRVLKTDPVPVLALLPQLPESPQRGLERVDGGLNAPFRERSSRDEPAAWLPWRHPVLWIVVLLLAAAAAFVLVPMQPGTPPAAEPKLDAAPAPVMPPSGAGATPSGDAPAAPATPSEPASGVVIGSGAAPAAVPVAVGNADTVAATATTTGAASAATPASSAFVSVADASLVLRALQPTWVQAVDGNGQTLMARLVPAGETVALSPALPVRLRIGNARGTELLFRGQPVNLATARDNIANITLP